jgi:multidrug efflux pump subunit AcrA (membrane-fusion protein)
VLERRLDKTTLRAPADGVVSVIVAEVGENVRAGQPVLAIQETGKQWLSFNAREDLLRGLTVGASVDVGRAGASGPTCGRHRARAARGRSRPGRPSAPSATTIATHCACASTRKDATAFEPGMTCGSFVEPRKIGEAHAPACRDVVLNSCLKQGLRAIQRPPQGTYVIVRRSTSKMTAVDQ